MASLGAFYSRVLHVHVSLLRALLALLRDNRDAAIRITYSFLSARNKSPSPAEKIYDRLIDT